MPSVDTDKWKAIEANSNTLSMPASDRNLIMKEGYIVIDSLRLRASCRGPLASPKEKKSLRPLRQCLTYGGQHEKRDLMWIDRGHAKENAPSPSLHCKAYSL
ncbi:hypothetical protein FOZ63_007651 [Perkinsus olseni]|uniref:Uncharacterized protein n=1 Tax=Perkinsus olseni TaxID=32597 RepID=A0A7J6UG15_PEROL|nr:hypothetical protein FOZ63_007651 [Perkinsus olseni]